MTDYKTTLNLPKTAFPMKANLAQREPQMLKRWYELDLKAQLDAQGEGRKKFILHDGPPYANGEIHIGHALNKILKDIIIKSKSLSGYYVPYIPGWDCHGLPIEHQVEKKKGKAGQKIDYAQFRQACREYAGKQVKKQMEGFKRLGIIGDWDHPYLTMDFKFEADTVRSLGKIIKNGHLDKGYKPVHWCIDCHSALAEAEVEYEDRTSPAIDVRFYVSDVNDLLKRITTQNGKEGKGKVSLVIWTTTPWTLPANQAVCLNPDVDYALVQTKGVGEHGQELLILAEPMLAGIMARYECEDYEIVSQCKGRDLEGLMLKHPFYEKEVPVVLGDHVTLDTGTGAVHTAPGHGQEDYVVANRYDLEVYNPVGGNGVFLEETELFAGVHVFKANDAVLEVLKSKSTLVHLESINHSYPHCWRHKSPIIFRATPQWFISMTKKDLQKTAMSEIEKVQWIPDWGKNRISAMVSNRPDWCISRQRTWGVPITLFVHKESGELHPRTDELFEKVAKAIEEGGIDAWFDASAEDFINEDATEYEKVSDTVDVWLDSGVSHYAVIEQREELSFPADLYLEGSDQHRGWFQSSLLTSCAINQKAPYKAVLTHGFTMDEKGEKMSKSQKNAVAPQKVMNKSGADILRLWVASTDYTKEQRLSDEILKGVSDIYRRIRNTCKYLLSNLSDFDPAVDLIDKEKMLPLDRWAVAAAYRVQNEVVEAYDNYHFNHLYQKIHNFCSVEMSGFYLDITKDRQYTMQASSLARRSSQTATYHLLNAMTRWLAPILCFTADEIWQLIPGKTSDTVFTGEWYQGLSDLDENSEMNHEFWLNVIEVRDAFKKEMEKVRVSAEGVGSSLDVEADIYCNGQYFQSLEKLDDEFRFLLITSYARIHDKANKSSAAAEYSLSNDNKVWVHVHKANSEKCVRCWHHREDVGQSEAHPEICSRCESNVAGEGESRLYV